MNIGDRLNKELRTIVDFPKPGIMFKDITPVLENPSLCRDLVEVLRDSASVLNIDAVVGIESRGFLFGLPLALELEVPFIPIRKKGKLPYKTVSYAYDLEYGSATIEMHQNTIQNNWNVLVHDDLLATGGTAKAAAELVKMEGGKIAGFSFLIGLNFLGGKEALSTYSKNIFSIKEY
ncbi:MAG: adenine phosphoribosyltransferase [Crocinitomicaceae bacterium]|jgi:adenine phosphoribosyltransferase|nr:adenine phosphoribosyltransferase [Crocinitomicaceae bacterium]